MSVQFNKISFSVPQPKESKRDSVISESSNNNYNNSRRISKKRSRKEPITYYELLELERQKNEAESLKVKIKRTFPLAPDGFIPNSVVKKFFQLLDEPPEPDHKLWKLKWKPVVNTAKVDDVIEEADEADYVIT